MFIEQVPMLCKIYLQSMADDGNRCQALLAINNVIMVAFIFDFL